MLSDPGPAHSSDAASTLSDPELAASLARSAGQRLLDLRERLRDLSAAELKERGDGEGQRALAEGLAAARPATPCSPRRRPTTRPG